MKYFFKTFLAGVFGVCLFVAEQVAAQDQTVNGNLNIGAGFQSELGYAPGIFFLGNSDDFFIRRYNRAPNQSEFRFAIGDDLQAEDRFVIGVNYGNTTWYDRMVVQGDGKVGIGTSTPGAQLQIGGGALVVGTHSQVTNTDGHLSIGDYTSDSNPNTTNWTNESTLLINGNNYTTIGFHDSGNRVDYIRAGQGTIQMGYDAGWGRANIGMPLGIWNAQGNVGIGTLNPKEALSVNGKIRAHEIKVGTSNWPDYVFEEGYQIGKLEELESYIKTHKHLPDMPSAKEVEANGIALGEMVKMQQQKIEELSLYLIQQAKIAQGQSDDILHLQIEIKKIKSQQQK